MATAKNSREYAEEVANRCAEIAANIAKKGERIRLMTALLRFTAALVGIAAIIVAYVPEAKSIVGNAAQYFSLSTALTLVLSSLGSMLLYHNPPEWYAVFARYIDYYDNRLREILSDEPLSNPVRIDRLREVTNLATVNINDVKAMWLWVEKPN